MKKDVKIICCLFWSLLFGMLLLSCSSIQSSDDSRYFNGSIMPIKDISKADKLDGTEILLEGVMVDDFAVYDSLIIFYAFNHPETFFNIYNLNTKEHLGGFCRKGRGPSETTCVLPIWQFYQENGALKTILSAGEEKLMFWNISESLKEHKSIYDTIIPYEWRKEQPMGYLYTYRLGADSLLLYASADYVTVDAVVATLPYYQLRTIGTNEKISEYQVFKKAIPNGNSRRLMSRSFFYSNDCLKPDHSKIAQGMSYLNQLNIIDLTSGEVAGYRVKGAADFSVFKKDLSFYRCYYASLQSDDRFIYALTEDGAVFEGDASWHPPHILSVFNWEGRMVNKFDLGREFTNIWLDQINHILYAANRLNGDVYYYNLKL